MDNKMNNKRCLYRYLYFGNNRYFSVRNTGKKSKRKLQELIDSKILDLWIPIETYRFEKEEIYE